MNRLNSTKSRTWKWRVVSTLSILVILSTLLGCAGSPSPTPTLTPAPTPTPTAKPAPTPTPTTPVNYTLTVSLSPTGSGTVNLTGSGIYAKGETVTLTAMANPTFQFSRWSGGASGNSPTVTVTMNENLNVVANFTKITFNFSATVATPGAGQVNPSSGSFEHGSRVNITATPSAGFVFDRWEGDASGTANPVSITMDANKKVVAYFKQDFQVIEYTMPPGAGSATWIFYSKDLKAGDVIEGVAEISGAPHSLDQISWWTFRVLGPSQIQMQNWEGNIVSSSKHEIGITTPYTGRHTIMVSHVSRAEKKITIRIRPVGWTAAFGP